VKNVWLEKFMNELQLKTWIITNHSPVPISLYGVHTNPRLLTFQITRRLSFKGRRSDEWSAQRCKKNAANQHCGSQFRAHCSCPYVSICYKSRSLVLFMRSCSWEYKRFFDATQRSRIHRFHPDLVWQEWLYIGVRVMVQAVRYSLW